MQLVELISTPATEAGVLDDLEAFVTTSLGKGAVRAYDTPNFIANRVGIAGMLATMKEVENFGLTYDVVDDLTGKKLGRASSSGTFRTADVVGLDTMAHVIKTLQDNLNEQTDPFYASFATPAVLKTTAGQGQPGPEGASAGFYKKVGRDVLRFDAGEKGLCARRRQGRRGVWPHAQEARRERLKLLRNAQGGGAAFPVGHPAQQLSLCCRAPGDIAETARDRRLRDALGLWHEAGPV
jgi:3-hydroxyacyl-CoA dehydrogenase